MKKFIIDIKKYYKYIWYSGISDLKSEVSRSYLGCLWWFINPLLFNIIYIFLSKIVFGKSEAYFSLFILIGIITWNFFNSMLLSSLKILENNKQIISKVYIPKYILVISKSISLSIKYFISFIIVIVFIFYYKINFNFNMLYIFLIFLVYYIFTVSVSILVMHLSVLIEDMQNILNLFLKILFYISGVFYNINKRIPKPYKSILSRINPTAFFIIEFRKVILYNVSPSFKGLTFWLIISIIILNIGIRLVRKYDNTYVKVI